MTNDSFPVSFPVGDRNRVRRAPKRGDYDRERVYDILDRAPICHVGIATNAAPTVIPMLFVRMGDSIVVHGASRSRLITHLATGAGACVTVTHLDGLVLARSMFHHSMNYRSVVVFGRGRLIDDADDRHAAILAITDKVVPGRSVDSRYPNATELRATAFVAIDVDTASAKVRTGGPVDEDEDYDLPHWAGVVPIRTVLDAPMPDDRQDATIAAPEYLRAFIERANRK